MNNKIKLVIVPLVIALGACSSSDVVEITDVVDDGTGNTGGTTVTITVTTETGGTHVLQGVYASACYLSGGSSNYVRDSHEIDGDVLVVKTTTYTDNVCSVVDSESTLLTATLSVDSDGMVSSWVDGMSNPIQPPATSDGTRLLSNFASYTLLNTTFVGGATGPSLFYVVDDTDSTPVLYRDDDASGGVVSTADPLQ